MRFEIDLRPSAICLIGGPILDPLVDQGNVDMITRSTTRTEFQNRGLDGPKTRSTALALEHPGLLLVSDFRRSALAALGPLVRHVLLTAKAALRQAPLDACPTVGTDGIQRLPFQGG